MEVVLLKYGFEKGRREKGREHRRENGEGKSTIGRRRRLAEQFYNSDL
jgi:hypothetical protein